MKPKHLVKGMRVEVNPFRRDYATRTYDVAGMILCRRGSFIRFMPDAESLQPAWKPSLSRECANWTQSDYETYRVHVHDVISVNGTPIEEWAKL